MLLFRFDPILLAAAVIPAVALLIYVYRADRLEPETPRLLLVLVIEGIIATALAAFTERIGVSLLGRIAEEDSLAYAVVLFYLVVGLSEEGFKYLLLKRRTWNHPGFDCQFDGVVYAVFVSLGFALWENIEYVVLYGFGTAVVRAVTAVPGHACFGVFMGAWYGLARRYGNAGEPGKSRGFRILALITAVFLHGSYDLAASLQIEGFDWFFAAFAGVMFLVSWLTVRSLSARDHYIG